MSNSRNECPKTFWKHIRTLVTRNKKGDTLAVLKTTENGNEHFYCTDEETAEGLNRFFSFISTVDDSNANLPPPPFVSMTNTSPSRICISTEEMENMISTLNINKTAEPDLISHKLLKLVKYSTIRSLTKRCLNTLQQFGTITLSVKRKRLKNSKLRPQD